MPSETNTTWHKAGSLEDDYELASLLRDTDWEFWEARAVAMNCTELGITMTETGNYILDLFFDGHKANGSCGSAFIFVSGSGEISIWL